MKIVYNFTLITNRVLTLLLVAGLFVLSSCGKPPAEEAPEPEILIEGEILVDGVTVCRIESCFYRNSAAYLAEHRWQLVAFEKCYADYISAVKDAMPKLWYHYQSKDDGEKIIKTIMLVDVAGHSSLGISLDNGNIVTDTGVASVETFDVKPFISQNKQHIKVDVALTTEDGKHIRVYMSGIAVSDGRIEFDA